MNRILIIDDDEELCELVSEFLTVEGFTVAAVHDGAEGLRQAASDEFDLITLDVMLPGINGFAVLRELRRTSRIPVLMLTARGDDTERIVGLESGADDYLAKPFNPRELVARIRAVLRRTKNEDEPEPSAAHEKINVDDIEISVSARSAGAQAKI
jgi:two-component system response regulator CpxR